MKKIEPTKNVTPMAGREARRPLRGERRHREAQRPHREQHAHPPAAPPWAPPNRFPAACLACPAAETCPLRCARERQRTSVPSGRRRTSLVTNGPGPSCRPLPTRSGCRCSPRSSRGALPVMPSDCNDPDHRAESSSLCARCPRVRRVCGADIGERRVVMRGADVLCAPRSAAPASRRRPEERR